MNRKILPFCLFILIFYSLYAQPLIPLNTWRIHTNRTFTNSFVFVNDKIWVGTKGGVFVVNNAENTIQTYTKLDGLPDLEVSALGYDAATRKIIFSYANGDIYIYDTRTEIIVQLPYVLNANNIFGSKKTNEILFFNQRAYLFTDFGAVVVNLIRNEVAEAWLAIGPNGSSLSVFGAAIKGDSILLATSRGLQTSRINASVNLMDFNSWRTYRLPTGIVTQQVSRVNVFNQNWILAANNAGIYEKTPNSWNLLITTASAINQLKVANSAIYAVENNRILTYNGNSWNSELFHAQSGALQVIELVENHLWAATAFKGLAKKNLTNNQVYFFAPQGPHTNEPFRLQYVNNQLFLLSGGYDPITTPQFKAPIYSTFNKGEWQVFEPFAGSAVFDLVGVAYNPFTNRYLFASAWNGAILKNATGEITIINDNTESCPLINTSFGVRVTDIVTDEVTGFNWVANIGSESAGNPSFFRLGINNTCQSYAIPDAEARYPLEIVIDNAGNKWARLRNRRDGGVLVFNERFGNGNVPAYRIFRLGAGNGNLTNQYVRCIVKDRNGDIWIGTENGVNVFFNTAFALNPNVNADAVTPIFENRPLLFDQPVNAIAVDGGNRKWIGTCNGVYLFSADGTRQIHYFNRQNSPLMSDNIVSIAIDPTTGEVFIATDKGVVSYREAATTGNDDNPSVVVFPNPMRSNFTGTVGITGLATDAVVKITDINGVLVHETTASGGTASWNGRDYNGRKIQPGVYIILTAKDDGSSAVAGKLFVTD